MLAALVTGKGSVELLEFREPRPAEGQAVVQIALCGICGTDVHAYQSGRPYNPALCGHEWTGTVAAIGAGVTHLREGDRVVSGISPACGICPSCRAGDAARCTTAFLSIMGGPGGAPHGGFAPAIAAPASRLFPIPDNLTDVEAALIEPLTVALHAVRRTPLRLGDTVAILGAGPIGLLTMQCANASGARTIVIEPEPNRAQMARETGAGLVLDPRTTDVAAAVAAETGGLGPEVVFECAGIPATIQQAVDLVRRGGSVTLVGLAEGEATITPGTWLSKEVTFRGAVAYLHDEFNIAIRLVVDRRVDVAPLHTATFPLAQAADAFAALDRDKSQVKVLIDPRV